MNSRMNTQNKVSYEDFSKISDMHRYDLCVKFKTLEERQKNVHIRSTVVATMEI